MTHSGKRTALMIASVGTMIDSFNRDNIRLLSGLGYEVHVAANFVEGNPSISRTHFISQCRGILINLEELLPHIKW